MAVGVLLGDVNDLTGAAWRVSAEDALTGGALRLPDLLALFDAAGSRRQALEIRPHVDVPGLDLGGGGGAADAGVFRLGEGKHRKQCDQDQGERKAPSKPGHSPP